VISGFILADSLKPGMLASLLRKILEQGKGRTAQKVRGILHAAYERALSAQFDPSAELRTIDTSITSNPVSVIPTLSEHSRARKRVLNKSELSMVWHQIQLTQSNAHDVAVRALRLGVLLGGQRCQQLLRVKVTDVNLDSCTICLRDGKGNRSVAREHILPLAGKVLPEVEWLLDHARRLESPDLFPSSVQGKAIDPGRISSIINHIFKKMHESDKSLSHFQFSDLRRTAETTLASLGVSKDHRAQLQSHGISGVQARHYDMYDYIKEKQAAILLWQEHLESLLPAQQRTQVRTS